MNYEVVIDVHYLKGWEPHLRSEIPTLYSAGACAGCGGRLHGALRRHPRDKHPPDGRFQGALGKRGRVGSASNRGAHRV